MDVPRKGAAKARMIKRISIGVVLAILIPSITIGLKRLQPAAQSVERSTVWPDTVKRGEMIRNVRGLGTRLRRASSAPTHTEGIGQRSSFARIASADWVQTKGFGLALNSAR